MRFDELDLPDLVQQGIASTGFTELTPVQEQTIPLALAGRDVAAQAQTGTGKTAAFLISLFTRLLRQPATAPAKGPRALVLAPTRELVVQICQDADDLGRACPFRVQPVFGGVDYDKQRRALQEGVDIVVATPGRLIDYLKQRVFDLKQIDMLVIDEADRMFDLGFISDLRYILRKLPPFEQRQTMLLSATLDRRVMELAYEFMNIPEKVEVAPEQVTAERVEQVLYHVSQKEKFPLLLGLLQHEGETERVLVFVNTKIEAERLCDRLNANDLAAGLISGDIPQRKRLRLLEQFKNGEMPFLVATDVASRGLHIDGVTHVINYDLPQDAEDYVHRIGRTARAGAAGKALSLADEETVYHLADIETYIGQRVPSAVPDEEFFVWEFKDVPRRSRPPRDQRAGGGRGGSGRGGAVRSGGRSRGGKPAAGKPAAAPAATAASEGGEAAKKRRRPRRGRGGSRKSVEKPESVD